MVARRHGPTTAVPSHGQAWRRRARALQHHHGEAHGRATAPGTSAATRSPWITTISRAEVLGAKRGGDEEQIGAVDLKRRRTAVQTHPISPASMAGVGRRNSAKAAATRSSRHSTTVSQMRWGRTMAAAKHGSTRINGRAVERPFVCGRSRRRGRPEMAGTIRRRGRRCARRQSSRVRVRTRAREKERLNGLGRTRWVGQT